MTANIQSILSELRISVSKHKKESKSLAGYGFKRTVPTGVPLRKGTVKSIKTGKWLYSDEFTLKVEKILCGNSLYRRQRDLYDLIAYDLDIDLEKDNSSLLEHRIRIYLGEDLSAMIKKNKKTIQKGELVTIQHYAITRTNENTFILLVYKIKGKN